MLRSIESAAAAVGDEIYEHPHHHPHQHPHQSHCHRNMPSLTTLDNGKEKTNRFVSPLLSFTYRPRFMIIGARGSVLKNVGSKRRNEGRQSLYYTRSIWAICQRAH